MYAGLVGKTIDIVNFADGGRYEVLAYDEADRMLKLHQVTRFIKTKPFWIPVSKIDQVADVREARA